MKKTILTFVCICLITLGAQAQGLYIGANFGYGLSAGGNVLGANDNSNGSSNVVKGSYGAGMTPGLSVGLMFSRSIGAELNFGYLMGQTYTIKDEFGNNTGMDKYSATCFYINPSLVLRASCEGKVIPYAKLGVFSGLATKGNQKFTSTQVNGAGVITGSDETEVELKGHMAMGVTSALGIDFMLSNKFAIFGEVNSRLATWSPASYTSSSTTTDYIAGVGQVPQHSSVSGNFTKETPPNYTGTDALANAIPFSAIGFNVGVKLYLGN